MSSTASTAIGQSTPGRTREARFVTWIVVAFLVWIPLQTPVAVLAYQYLRLPISSIVIAQGLMLVKDIWAVALILVLFVRHAREIRFRWFDWFAIAYGVLVIVYSVGPAVLGSHLSAVAVIASARALLVPVELYVLGRLVGYAGVSVTTAVKAFLVVAAVAAVGTVAEFIFAPGNFWVTTYDLVFFIRDVQGVPGALDTWTTSIFAIYGSLGSADRSVGPFAHPVAAGVYFIVPLTLAVCAAWMRGLRSRTTMALTAVGVVLLTLAVLTPISRGAWVGFLCGMVICGAVLHRYRLAVATAVVFVAIVVFVPPFSWSVRAPVAGDDSSTIGHVAAVTNDVTQVITSDPVVGPKVGNGDSTGQNLSPDGDAAGVGENMYLTTYASVGPLGLLAFVIWLGALMVELVGRVRPTVPVWISVGIGAALFGELVAGMTASTLMRFTPAASLCLLVGLILAQPQARFKRPDLSAVRHPRRWLGSRRARVEPA